MRFSKWHALGNAYLLVERVDAGGPLTGALVRRLCDVHRGIGADGVLEVLGREGRSAQVVIWNPDGSTAELSGNGTRIAARWLARKADADVVEIVVGPRRVEARLRDGGPFVEQDLGPVAVSPPESLALDAETATVTPVVVGNPHAVLRHEPTREELLRLGPAIESHPRFPARTNVQLVQVDDRHGLTVAVWERGAGETPSSGTSACAAAAAAIANGWCESPVAVRLPGGVLEVAIDARHHALLTGPAQEICSGAVSSELLADSTE